MSEEVIILPSFIKDEMKKKDEQKLEEMQQEIDEAEAAQEDAAEGSEEEAPEEAASEGAAMQEEIEALKGQVEKLTGDLQEKKDRLLRLQADFDNFRRRSAKEREEISAVVTQNFCKDMLPLLDNFEDLVITHADDNGRLDLSLLTDNNFDTTETTRIVNVQIDRSAFVADPSNGDRQQHGATIQRPSGAGLGGSTVRLAHTGAAVTAVFMLAAVTLTSGLVLIAGRRLRISRE